MDEIIYILLIHLNFALTWLMLFTREKIVGESLLRFGLLFLNLWLRDYSLFFLILLYLYNGFHIYQKSKNFFIIILLDSFCLNFIGISVFLTIEIPRFFADFNMLGNTILEIIILVLILLTMKKLENKFLFSSYLYAYKKRRVFSTVLIFFIFAFVMGYHLQFSNTSLDYILTSFILILINSFYGLLMLMILMNEKKEEYNKLYMESIKKNEEYYQRLEEFRHDYKNYIGVLENMLQENDSKEELRTVIKNERDFFDTQLNDALHMKLQKIYDPLLQGIFVKFINRAEELKIPYKIQVNNIIPKLSMNSYDMIRLFTNIFENALVHYDQKAAQSSDSKEIIIKIEGTLDFFTFEFSNPSEEMGPNLSRLLKKGATRQKESKGIGLYSVKKIVEQNKNLSLNLKYSKGNQRFFCTLTIDR